MLFSVNIMFLQFIHINVIGSRHFNAVMYAMA